MSSQWLLFALAMLFLVAVIVQMLPWGGLPRRHARTPAVRDAYDKVRAARSPEEKSQALLSLAELIAKDGGWRNARGYALRAAHLTPAAREPIDAIVKVLREVERWDALERILWRYLERGSEVQQRTAREHLLELYRGPLANSPRARAVRELAK